MDLKEKVTQAFVARWETAPGMVVRAPGRVNLIGEHTDYNDGFVMPMAIDRAVWIALRATGGRQVTLTSLDMGETASFDLDSLQNDQERWIEYVKGVAWALQERGYLLSGWEGVMAGDVPIGAGLSSSAALEMAAARAFMAVGGAGWEAVVMARAGQQAENEWLGVQTGIMDQMISAAGQAGHALLVDCRTLETEAVPLPAETVVVVLDTTTRRGLVDSAYNERRRQCEAAAAALGVAALRDVDQELFDGRAHLLEETVRRRARHVVTENARVLQARDAMQQGEPGALGRLMNASHRSLRDDFEVSSAELDAMVAIARQQPGCYGARMTGAGFGGCAVALVAVPEVAPFVARTAAAYEAATKLTPKVYVCQAAAGAELYAP
ncbi:MAG: galactokinase [Candidatus Promineifilaceae bacterium]|nr:galactokinase [Candidatus Promineifilaceae bacterium]